MTLPPLTMAWFQVLALLAAEVGLVALGVALLRRWSPSAAWRRTFCQTGITAALVITACEFSGSARILGGWAADTLSWRKAAGLPKPSQATPAQPPGALQFMGAMRGQALEESQPEPAATLHPDPVWQEQSEPPSADQTIRAAGDEASTPHFPLSSTSTSASTPRVAVPNPADAVTDSMGVLWLCLLWVAGAALAGTRACLAQCLFMIFQLRRRPVAGRALVERVQALAQALGIRRCVRVIESERLTSPIAFGLIRPTVGLPPGFAGRFDAPKQDAMLAHELAHLAAHDPFWCLLADVAAAVLWWHPGVWWLRRQLHLASEMAADEASLLVADGPRVLAECLVELGTRLTHPVQLGQLRVSGFRSHLGRRVQRLVHLEGRAWSPPSRLGSALLRIFGPMVMTIIVVLCTAWAAPQALTKGNSMQTIQLNWKRSLATIALLAAFNGPEATVAVAESDQPEAPPALPAPQVAPAAPTDSSTNSETGEALSQRSGPATRPAPPPPVITARQVEKPAHGAKLEAKLKEIVLPEVSFDNLPLGEVLRFLSEESVRRDPEKAGVNFLINPNFSRVARTGAVIPSTGLPLDAPAEQFDLAAVSVKFNLPLRKVTMKDVLDAIVTVADHPLEYTVEDYAVVFSAKPEAVARQPIVAGQQGMSLGPNRVYPYLNQMLAQQARPPSQTRVAPRKTPRPNVELADVKPQPFNIDFGSGAPSPQVGPAAAGHAGDYWNTVSVGNSDHHTESDLKFAGGGPSPIEVEMINLGGGYGGHSAMGAKYPMLDTINYPTGNKGGNSTVILHSVPAGKYDIYIYGYSENPLYWGDYTLTVGTHEYGRKKTLQKKVAPGNTKWVEDSQYVKFANVKVGEGEEVTVLIRPGAQVTDSLGRTFADAMIAGLQLIPEKRPGVAATGSRAPEAGRSGGVPPPRGLVSWWQAEGDARDAVGGNHGTLGNGVAFVPGRVGRAFSFNGEYHQYVRIPYSPTLITSNHSFEAWVKPTAQVSDPISQDLIFGQAIGTVQMVARPGATGVRIVFMFGTDKYTFHEVAGETEIPIGQFSHLAGTWDGTMLRLYINGTLDAENSPAAAPVDSGCDFFIGGFSTVGTGYCDYEGQFFKGLIDEAAFYRRALLAAEVQAIYKAGGTGKHRPAR